MIATPRILVHSDSVITSGVTARNCTNHTAAAATSQPTPGFPQDSCVLKKQNVKQILFKYFVIFTRVWGVITSIVLCGIGVEIVFYKHKTGYYFICGGVLLLLLETAWVVGVFLRLCIRNEQHRIFRCWSMVAWFESWKRTLVYGPLAALPIAFPHKMWLSYVAGGLLIALAAFHLALAFKGPRRRRRKERLLHSDVDSYESSRFEEVTEVLDDGLPEPMPGSSHSLSDTLVDQDTMLEI